MYKQELETKLRERTALIGIVGLGYVGLPLILCYCEAGYKTLGFDIDAEKSRLIKQGESYINHIPSKRVKEAAANSALEATTDFSRAGEVDALIICVPTPLDKFREPDLSYVTGTLDSLLPHMRHGQVVSLESTTYPGTTAEVLKPRLEEAGFEVGKDIFLVYSPEREDPSNSEFSTRNIPKICGGETRSCLEIGIALYDQVIEQVVPVSSTRVAEMTKLLENIHRAVNIGLINEMKIVMDKMGIDIYEVIRAAATKPFGFVPYYPGPGLGGHCIPIDPFYLTWKAREYGVHTRFIELAGEVNSAMPVWVVDKIIEALNQGGKAVKGSKILVLGIAYKKNVNDMRESPSIEIMDQLRDREAVLSYSDPHIPKIPPLRNHTFDLKSVNLTPEMLKSYDCVVLATDHDKFDYAMIKSNASLIVDTRGVYHETASNVVRA